MAQNVSRSVPFGVGLISGWYFFLFACFVLLSFLLFSFADGVRLGQSSLGGVLAVESPVSDRVYYPVDDSTVSQDVVRDALADELSGQLESIGKDAAKDVGRELVVAPALSFLNSLSSFILGIVGVAFLLFGLFYALLGAGLLYGWKWVRIVVVVFSFFAVLGEIPVFFLGGFWSGGFIIVANLLIAGYLLLNKSVKEWFG